MSHHSKEHQRAEVTPLALLIESSEQDAVRFEQLLRKVALHWRVVKVKDGFAGIQHMTLNGFPDLLVTCLETRRLGATDVVEWVRAMQSPGPIPVLIYDYTLPSDIRRQLQKFDVMEFLGKHALPEASQGQLLRMLEGVERAMYAKG